MMSLATVAFFASSSPVGFIWFFCWRLLSGLAGGTIMVLAATTILPQIAPARRGLASGAIFMGVGIGIAASGTLVPLLLRQGLGQAWIGLGVLSAMRTGACGAAGRSMQPQHTLEHHAHHAHHARPGVRLNALYVEYALNAFGLSAAYDFPGRFRGAGT